MEKVQIMVFVGNGFDISVLEKYGIRTTKFEEFYKYFIDRNPDRKKNSLIEEMENAKKNDKENWSDFEAQLNIMLDKIKAEDKVKNLSEDLNEIQKAFSRFLNEIVDDNLIEQISDDIEKAVKDGKSFALDIISAFWTDLAENQSAKIKFIDCINHNINLNYIFINFNFTSVLDNFIYLDKEVFEPKKFKSSENNFELNIKTKKKKDKTGNKKFFCDLAIKTHHPHGHQSIPKSLLFGTEVKEKNNESIYKKNLNKKFIKSYWARCNLNYGELFEESKLFIIYGCSLGESDSWWWNKIYSRLEKKDAELIIYNYGDEEENEIKKRYFSGCFKEIGNIEEGIKERIFVINFGPKIDKKIEFLQI